MAETGAPQPKKTRAQEVGILLLGRVATMIAEAAAPFLIVRLLGKADVGAIAGLMLIYTTLALVLGGGLPRSVLYYLSGRTIGERRGVVRRLTFMTLGLAAVTSLLMFGLAIFGEAALVSLGEWFVEFTGHVPQEETDSLDLVYLQLFALYPLLDMPVRLLPHIFIGEKRARYAAGFNTVRGFGMAVGQLLPAALGFGLWGIVGGLLSFGAFNVCVFLWSLRSLYGGAETIAPTISVGETLRFSFPLAVTDIVSRLNTYLDRYIILFFMGNLAFAEYAQGAWQIPLITTVAYAVGDVYMSRFVELFKAGRPLDAIHIWRVSIQKVSLVVVPVATVFIVGAEEFVVIAFTEDYAAAAPVFRFYCLFMLGRVTSYGSVIVAAGKPQYVLRAAAWGLGINAVLSPILAVWLGFVGPALATALTFIPLVTIYCYYIAKSTGLRLNQTFPLVAWGKVLGVASVPAAVALLVKFSFDLPPAWALGLEAVIILVGFSLLGTATGQIQRQDWRFAYSWIRLKIL